MIYDQFQRDKELRDFEDRRRLERMVLISVLCHAMLIYMIVPAGRSEIQPRKPPVEQQPTDIVFQPLPGPTRVPTQPPRHDTRKPANQRPIPAPEPDAPEMLEDVWEPELQENAAFDPDAMIFLGHQSLPPPVEQGPIELTTEVVKPRLIRRVNPEYPRLARVGMIEG
ncbi:hypothetical protein JW905_04285, partial [bacterium]|nr:hypothetical protein [candidate division CSSED10-310 bacterium]